MHQEKSWHGGGRRGEYVSLFCEVLHLGVESVSVEIERIVDNLNTEAGERFLQRAAWLEQGLCSQYHRVSVAETENLHHPLATLTSVTSSKPGAPSQDMWKDRDRERIEASQGRATYPQVVLLLLWVVKFTSNMGLKIAPKRNSQTQKWRINKVYRGKLGQLILKKRDQG